MRTLALLVLFGGLAGAQPATRIVWEYASVVAGVHSQSEGYNTWSGKATVCYADSSGCRLEEIVVTSRNPNPPLGEAALMKASAQLGEEGWELVGVTELRSEDPNLPHRLRQVFRRPKSK